MIFETTKFINIRTIKTHNRKKNCNNFPNKLTLSLELLGYCEFNATLFPTKEKHTE